jgi:hypothetical protein
MQPYDKEWTNIHNQTPKPDGRVPTRGRGYYATGEANEPTAAQLREPARRPQRRRGDGSLAPADAAE